MIPNPYVINFIYLSVYEKILLVTLVAIFVYFLIEVFILDREPKHLRRD